MESTILGSKTTLFGGNLKKQHFLVTGSSLGVPSEFSRSSVGGIREGIREEKETAILIKRTFSVGEFLGSSLVHPWFLLGLLPEEKRKGTRGRVLKKSVFCAGAGDVTL